MLPLQNRLRRFHNGFLRSVMPGPVKCFPTDKDVIASAAKQSSQAFDAVSGSPRRLWRLAMTLRRSSTGLRVSERQGTAAIEFGIIVPVMMLFILGVIDVGRLMFTAAALSHASAAAARCGVSGVCTTQAQVLQSATSQAWTLNTTNSNFSVSSSGCGLRVSACYSFKFYTPGLSSITLNPKVCLPSSASLSGSADDECGDE
jgi:hypothetical protein